MDQNGETRGVLPQIIVAVVVALLVGSTAPWWWSEFFHKTTDVVPTPKPTRDQNKTTVDGGQIQLRCTANPHSIAAGGQAEISVLAFTEQGSPVSDANVRIESGGGWFSASGTTTEIGQTNSSGVFTTQWRSPNLVASGYGMNVTVNKNGFTEGKGECNVALQ